jgi:hypothetical protein
MSRQIIVLVAILTAWTPAQLSASEASWIFRGAAYTHDETTGERVAKFAQEMPAIKYEDPTFERSAYRHTRTGIQMGDSFDFFHVVETWGQGVNLRPYGEWLRPYRAGATPYGPWGNPYGPWTTPFGSWVNPYGLGRLPNPAWNDAPGRPLPPAAAMPSPRAGTATFRGVEF